MIDIDKIVEEAARKIQGWIQSDPDHWAAVVKPGRILFELSGCPEKVAQEAFELAAHKLPVKTRYISRSQTGGVS